MQALPVELRQCETYKVLPQAFREAWVTACTQLPPNHHLKPLDGQVFVPVEGQKLTVQARDRLNDYGLVAGCEFVITNTRTSSIEISCKHFGSAKANKHKIHDVLVQRDTTTNQIVSDRQRNRADHRTGCKAQYVITYKQDPSVPYDKTKRWIGHWRCEQHEGHSFPTSPTAYLTLKRRFEEYRELESESRKLRFAKVPYSKARQLFLSQGISSIISPRQYYNLGKRLSKDLQQNDTPGALVAVFDELGWQYSWRTQIQSDDQGNEFNKIIQVAFWNPQILHHVRRFTSNALLIVDATFRTNRKGLPLLIAAGISNTGRTFPALYSWAPEEDADSYTFLFKVLRDEVYQDCPEPAVVLTDLSGGMTAAFDTQKCLPHSRLQYCSWHAVMAMRKWYYERGRYTSDEIKDLEAKSWAYVQSGTTEELDANRKILEDSLLDPDKAYITDNWRRRENRLIQCYTKQYTNLGSRATSRLEKYNSSIHKITNHQLSLHEAAEQLCTATNDFFRDFQDDIDKQKIQNAPQISIARYAFEQLTRAVSHQAITLIASQWRRLLLGNLPACTGHWRQEYLLPCAHDLQRAYDTGYPIPKSMAHPRWWLDGQVVTESHWQPVDVARTQRRPQNDGIEALVFDALAVADRMSDSSARNYERRLRLAIQKEMSASVQQVEFDNLPLSQIDDRPRIFKKALPTATEQQIQAARQAGRIAAQRARDDAVLSSRSTVRQQRQTTTITNAFGVPIAQTARHSSPSSQSSSSSQSSHSVVVTTEVIMSADSTSLVTTTTVTPAEIPNRLLSPSTTEAPPPYEDHTKSTDVPAQNDQSVPVEVDAAEANLASIPPSTAPPSLGRADKRKRAQSGYYVDLIAGKRR